MCVWFHSKNSIWKSLSNSGAFFFSESNMFSPADYQKATSIDVNNTWMATFGCSADWAALKAQKVEIFQSFSPTMHHRDLVVFWWFPQSSKNIWYVKIFTPPTTHMEPENEPLQEEIPFGKHHFQVQVVSFRGCSITACFPFLKSFHLARITCPPHLGVDDEIMKTPELFFVFGILQKHPQPWVSEVELFCDLK